MKNLVIVESPAKSKTIKNYLGKDFEVMSSIGHIRSIVKKTKDGTPPIDVQNNFETQYEVDPEKKKVITQLKKAVKEVGKENVWLATDEDREGEAIAWHLTQVLKLDPKTTKRITFHEITKSAIEEAIKKPRTIDMSLVQAQQARQILDRIVGFELSPVVWQKVPGGKSAGRVQSPAVRLLVEKEQEINKFASKSSFKVSAVFETNDSEIKSELNKKFETEEEANNFLNSLLDKKFTVSKVEKTPGKRNPSAPFTTSTLQQEANSKLGFSSKATMSAAQKLYQAGKITYMRTDSLNLSGQAIAESKKYITENFGEKYSQIRKFKTKSSGAQEAHEAIRPTKMSLEKASSSSYDQKLYDLIRRRTLASQMSPAEIEKTKITIDIDDKKLHFETKGEFIIFDGFLKVYGKSQKEDDILPIVNKGDELDIVSALAKEIFSKPPSRYTEGSLVKKLEDLGIGRPSTYATIIDTVQSRGYVEKGESEGSERQATILNLDLENKKVDKDTVTEKTGSNKGKLVPTPSGELIASFLTDHFTQIVDYDFTANVEEEFDKIASDNLAKTSMLKKFYTPFHELIEKSGGIDRSKVGTNRKVGIDPKTKKPVYARFGRFGPMLQLGETESEEKPKFSPLPAGEKLETVSLEKALKMFELPRTVGKTKKGDEIKANIGRFGPYIQVGKLFVSIKPKSPFEISEEEANELYEEKLKAEAAKNIADFGNGIKVLNGRFGPYVTNGKKNVKIPKDTDPKDITHDKAKEMLEAAPAKKTVRKPRKKTKK